MSGKNFNNFALESEKVKQAALLGMDKAVTKLQADTMDLTHVITGNLKRSWTHTAEETTNGIEGAVGSNLEYAPYEDDKHGNLSTALNDGAPQLFDIIAKEIKSAIGG